MKPHEITVTVCYPPDTQTPGFQEENKTKPVETRLISEAAGLFTVCLTIWGGWRVWILCCIFNLFCSHLSPCLKSTLWKHIYLVSTFQEMFNLTKCWVVIFKIHFMNIIVYIQEAPEFLSCFQSLPHSLSKWQRSWWMMHSVEGLAARWDLKALCWPRCVLVWVLSLTPFHFWLRYFIYDLIFCKKYDQYQKYYFIFIYFLP